MLPCVQRFHSAFITFHLLLATCAVPWAFPCYEMERRMGECHKVLTETQKERADMFSSAVIFVPRSESLAWRPDYYGIPTLRGSGGGENVQSLEQEMRRGRESILFRAQSLSSSSPAPRHNLLLSGDSSPWRKVFYNERDGYYYVQCITQCTRQVRFKFYPIILFIFVGLKYMHDTHSCVIMVAWFDN